MSLVTICSDACPLSCVGAEACFTSWPNAHGSPMYYSRNIPMYIYSSHIQMLHSISHHVFTIDEFYKLPESLHCWSCREIKLLHTKICYDFKLNQIATWFQVIR